MTTMEHLSEVIMELWNVWEIRGMVLFSLSLQIILIMFGSQRRYITRAWIGFIVWTGYLLADLVATTALGILGRSQRDSGDSSAISSNLIQAFWAPFLLLHLGGPDTITAYAVEDNELWLRHLFNLVVQVAVAFYAFFKSWRITNLTFIAIPVFITGIIKYGERIWVLRSSSAKHIKDSLLSAPPRLRLDTKEIMVVPRRHCIPITNCFHQADYLFKMSRYLYEDFILSFTELKDSHSIISICQSSKEAFKLVEVELGFIYDELYTKAGMIYTQSGIILRSISFLSSVSALVAFLIIAEKHACSMLDVAITHILLVGALVLELYAFFHLIFSDRTMIWLTKFGSPPTSPIHVTIRLHSYLTDGRRWSGSMAQYNLISYGLEMKIPNCLKTFGVDEIMKHMYINWKPVEDKVKDLIFKHLLEKGNKIIGNLQDTNLRRKQVAQRGDGVLERMLLLDEFRWCTLNVEFNQSLLIWHIATDLCYYGGPGNSIPRGEPKDKTCSEISKCLSHYMFYLLVLRPHMLPRGIGDAGSRYRDACKEIKRFFGEKKDLTREKEACKKMQDMEYAILEDIIATPIDTTTTIPGAYGSSKYMLVHGAMLAKQLQSLEFEEKWGMISEVWIEMLSYAACHCEWKEHVQQLRRGGELLTHVCFLMTHLGLSNQYQEVLVN